MIIITLDNSLFLLFARLFLLNILPVLYGPPGSGNRIHFKLVHEFDLVNNKWDQLADLSEEHELSLDLLESCNDEQGNAIFCADRELFYVCVNFELSSFHVRLEDGALKVRREVYRQRSDVIEEDTEVDSRRDFSLMTHQGLLYLTGGCSRISEVIRVISKFIAIRTIFLYEKV